MDMLGLFDAASQYDIGDMRKSFTKVVADSKCPDQVMLQKIPFMNKKELMKAMGEFYFNNITEKTKKDVDFSL